MPPSVGTRMTRLFDALSSCSTSKYCWVSASGVSVVLSRRCCSAWSRATSTRCRSVSICCSCAILLLIAWMTCAGGCRSRRKNAVTVAMRNGGPPARGCVTSAESTRSSIVLAICVRFEMSLIEYCTIPSRTPLANRVAHRAVDLVLVADLGVDVRGLGRIDLPPQADIHRHPHLLARECGDLLDLLAGERILLFAGRIALDRRPGRARSGCRAAADWDRPSRTRAARRPRRRIDHDERADRSTRTTPKLDGDDSSPRAARRRRARHAAALSARTVAAPRRRKKAMARSTKPKTRLPMATPSMEEGYLLT